MTTKPFLITAAVFTVLACDGGMSAQAPAVEYVRAPTVIYMTAPVVNIGNRHGNLRNAQIHIVQAYQKIQRAQHDNDGQLGGHAQKAKELLIQADAELRMAANVSNAEGR